jgi:hypothetical protein
MSAQEKKGESSPERRGKNTRDIICLVKRETHHDESKINQSQAFLSLSEQEDINRVNMSEFGVVCPKRVSKGRGSQSKERSCKISPIVVVW